MRKTRPMPDKARSKESPLRILIVEDVDADAELMCVELSNAGINFTARRVDSKDDFIRQLETFSPDVILADYSLPAFDGMTALAITRRHKPGLPFIFVSGAIGEERAIELLREGALDYILKDRLSRLPSAVLRTMREIREKEQRKAVLQNYHDKLRSMTSQLTLAEERERRRLAMELHERIGQTLAISKLKLEAFRAAAQQLNKSALNDILHLIDTAIQDTRLLTKELSSPVLDQFGFVAAAEWLIEHMQERYDIRINFSAEADIKTPEPDCQILLYQATRELLMNSIKHAKAQLIEVRVGMESDMLRIRVKDDGIGFANLSETFSESAGSLTGGFGLFSIRERLDHIGGSLSIESKEGKGACITILAPQLKSEKRRRATDRLII